MSCVWCEKDTEWIRHTQFAGDHPFCKEHAEKESDFKVTDSSYFYWKHVGEKK